MINVLVRGGGDLASGAILRMARAGFNVIVSELPQPLAVRRTVSFAEAVYAGNVTVESIRAILVRSQQEAGLCFQQGNVAVLVDPSCACLAWFHPDVIVDARMTKQFNRFEPSQNAFVVGMGPGFIVGENCQAIVETIRGPNLGRVIWHGAAEADTGEPDSVLGFQAERVLRSPKAGLFQTDREIGERIKKGDVIAEVDGESVIALFNGIIRGLLHPSLWVEQGVKIGDLDPRDDPTLCKFVSDKALSIGGGVMEAILSKPELRRRVCA